MFGKKHRHQAPPPAPPRPPQAGLVPPTWPRAWATGARPLEDGRDWLGRVRDRSPLPRRPDRDEPDRQERCKCRRVAQGRSHHQGRRVRARRQGQERRRAEELVLVQSKTLTVKDPAFRVAIADLTKTLASFPKVTQLQTPPLTSEPSGDISKDGHAALIKSSWGRPPPTTAGRPLPRARAGACRPRRAAAASGRCS